MTCIIFVLLLVAPLSLDAQSIHIAALSGDYEMVEQALDAGADPNGYNSIGFAPLHSAARGGYLDITNLLLDNGAKVDLRTNTGDRDTALRIAVLNNHIDVMEALLMHDADPNVRNNIGNTALHEASIFGSTAAVRLLQRYGSNDTLVNREGQTARDINRTLFLIPDGLHATFGFAGVIPFENALERIRYALQGEVRVGIVRHLYSDDHGAFFAYGGAIGVAGGFDVADNNILSPSSASSPRILEVHARLFPLLGVWINPVQLDPFLQYILTVTVSNGDVFHSIDLGLTLHLHTIAGGFYAEAAYRFDNLENSDRLPSNPVVRVGVGYVWWI